MSRAREHPSFRRERLVLGVKDVMQILGLGKSKSYALISALNKELVAKGVIKDSIKPGYVHEKYFHERVFLDTSAAPTRTANN